jgi:Ni/Co efflux regulator RcnB
MRRIVLLVVVVALMTAMMALSAGVAQAQIIRLQHPSCPGLTKAAEHSEQEGVQALQEERCTFF